MRAQTAARWTTLTVWAVVAATGAFWALRLFAPATPVPAHAVSVSGAQALRGDPARLLGSPEEPAPVVVVKAPSRFKLIGVAAPRSAQAAGEGLALIAIDGEPAKAFRVGSAVEGDLVLQRVHARGADLGARGAGSPSMALELAALPPAATGTLPGAQSGAQPPRRPLPAMAPPPAPPPPVAAPEPVETESEIDTETPPDAEPAPPRPGVETR